MKYRKKPIIIEATQFDATGEHIEGLCFCPCVIGCPKEEAHVHTLEGPLKVSLGDWVITGVNGERYPCKPDIFEKTYEKVEP